MLRVILSALISSVLLTPAYARHHRHYIHHHRFHSDYNAGQVVGSRPSGCPYMYCGCGTSLHLFGKIIPELNLAINWSKFPPASPAPGMAAYNHHHVFAIESVNPDGTVVAYDSNSGGGLTRVHTVNLAHYKVVNPHATAEMTVASVLPEARTQRFGYRPTQRIIAVARQKASPPLQVNFASFLGETPPNLHPIFDVVHTRHYKKRV